MPWFEFPYDGGFLLKAFLSIVSVVILWRYSKRKRRFPPGPSGLPLLGYIPFLKISAPERLAKLGEKYGPCFSLNLGGKMCVVLSQYDVVHEALVKKAHVFSGREASPILLDIGAANGILMRDYGETWKKLRKFGISTLKGFGVGKRSMEDRINEEIRYLLEEVHSEHAKAFDPQELLSSAMCNVIWSVVSGQRFDYNNKKFRQLMNLNTQRFNNDENANKLRILDRFPLLKHFGGFKLAHEALLRQVEYVKEMCDETIAEHRKTYDSGDIRDFIDAFLQEIDRHKQQHFTREILDVIIRDLFNAGTETTTTTLRWCFLYLGSHPDFQDRLRDEVHSVCGNSGVLTIANRDVMPLTCSFIHEIQRAKPIVAIVGRKTCEPVEFRGYDLPMNTEVLVNIWQVHHDSETFVDPLSFWPERFIDADGKFCKHDHVIPYSLGARYCLGMHLAEMEVFMFLTGILRNFRIVEDPEYPLPSFARRIDGIVSSPFPYRARFVMIP